MSERPCIVPVHSCAGFEVLVEHLSAENPTFQEININIILTSPRGVVPLALGCRARCTSSSTSRSGSPAAAHARHRMTSAPCPPACDTNFDVQSFCRLERWS